MSGRSERDPACGTVTRLGVTLSRRPVSRNVRRELRSQAVTSRGWGGWKRGGLKSQSVISSWPWWQPPGRGSRGSCR